MTSQNNENTSAKNYQMVLENDLINYLVCVLYVARRKIGNLFCHQLVNGEMKNKTFIWDFKAIAWTVNNSQGKLKMFVIFGFGLR